MSPSLACLPPCLASSAMLFVTFCFWSSKAICFWYKAVSFAAYAAAIALCLKASTTASVLRLNMFSASDTSLIFRRNSLKALWFSFIHSTFFCSLDSDFHAAFSLSYFPMRSEKVDCKALLYASFTSSAASPIPFMLSAASLADVFASSDLDIKADMISVSATMAMPTPVETNKPCIASFSVVALTAAPRNVAEITFTMAFTLTAVAFHTNAAALVAIIRVLTIPWVTPKVFNARLSIRTATILFPTCDVIFRYGIIPPIADAMPSVNSPILFLSIWKLAAPLLLMVAKASSIVPALPFIASTFSPNLTASCPVSGPKALRLSALPNNLP